MKPSLCHVSLPTFSSKRTTTDARALPGEPLMDGIILLEHERGTGFLQGPDEG
jgi:hypothetical protein